MMTDREDLSATAIQHNWDGPDGPTGRMLTFTDYVIGRPHVVRVWFDSQGTLLDAAIDGTRVWSPQGQLTAVRYFLEYRRLLPPPPKPVFKFPYPEPEPTPAAARERPANPFEQVHEILSRTGRRTHVTETHLLAQLYAQALEEIAVLTGYPLPSDDSQEPSAAPGQQ